LITSDVTAAPGVAADSSQRNASMKLTRSGVVGSMRGIISRGLLWHRFGLAIAAAFSVVLLIPLIHSYFYQGVIGCIWKISASPTQGERMILIGNWGGIIRLNFDDSPGGPVDIGSVVSRRGSFFWWAISINVSWDYFRKTFWAIGYYRSPTSYYRSPTAALGETENVVNIPAWMLIALCGIAPSLWLRRHLRRRAERNQRGFAVEPSNGT